MSFWSRLTRRRKELAERRRTEAVAKAMARGATPQQAMAAGERAANGSTNAAVTSAISS